MGHVDHGKTTLLDAIRTTKVAEREAGGITQHIGAYQVTVNNRPVVFLDTPGHEAFTLMRARGARVTDIVILVVAADDGVMPQTKEAIDHARAAGVPIIVAINKIDKPEANLDRVMKDLGDLGLMPEQWGGQTVTVPVSAKKKQNLELLLEMILLVTDIGELKANPKAPGHGAVLEAKLDKGRGPVATVLVQNGTLHVGDTVIAGSIIGKVRALIDDRGHGVKQAGPSTPVEVLGLTGLPAPGDTFQVIADQAKARQVASFRQTQARDLALGAKGPRLTLEGLKDKIAEGSVKELPILVKADVQGSAEVLAATLAKLSDEKVKIRIIHSGVGAINLSDVLLASASDAIIIGFNVRPDRSASELAERDGVEIRQHSVIYHVTDEIKKAMVGLLEPTFREVRVGSAEVRETFRMPKFGTIAGCMVIDGRMARDGRDPRPPHPRPRRGARGQDRLAAPVQGRRERSEGRHRVRHQPRTLQRHQGRGRDRGLSRSRNWRRCRRPEPAAPPRLPRNASRTERPMPQGHRPDRLGDQIRTEVSDILAREVHDPGVGFVTITRVSLTADLQIARVYYTTMAAGPARKDTARALQRATPFVRRQLAGRLGLRRMPELEFRFDQSIEQHARIEELIHEIHEQDAAREAEHPDAGDAADGERPREP